MNHPDRLSFRRGGGALALFGIPFFAMGLLAMIAGVKGDMKTDGGETLAPLLAFLFTLPFVAVGAGLIFGRMGVDIDRRGGSVHSWWGLLLPFRSKRHDLEDFTHVTLTRKVIRSKNSSRIVFPVALARTAGDDVECASLSTYPAARVKAEALARFTCFDLHDSAEGPTVVREAAFLDETVAQRARRLGLHVEWPEPPADCRIGYELLDDTAVFRLPPPRLGWMSLLFLLPVLIFIGFAVVSVFLPFLARGDASAMSPQTRLLFFGAFGLMMLIPLVLTFGAWARTGVLSLTIAASSQGIRIEKKRRFGTKRWTFPSAELEELSLTSGAGGFGLAEVLANAFEAAAQAAPVGRHRILFRSDRDHCVLRGGLRQEEARWLHAALTYILVNAPH